MSKKINKYIYLWVIQCDYGYNYGFEDVTQAENYKEARGYLRDYRQNDVYAKKIRMIKRRELNPEYNQNKIEA